MSSSEMIGATLVLGGARSGKSHFAEELVAAQKGKRVYIATGQSLDAEMADRIDRHRLRRDRQWRTVEAAVGLPAAIRSEAQPGNVLLVDSVTMWISNLMMAGLDMNTEIDALNTAIIGRKAPVVLVSDEVGLGIVPDNAAARAFRDHAGTANQTLAQIVDEVYLVTAGIPLLLKPQQGTPR